MEPALTEAIYGKAGDVHERLIAEDQVGHHPAHSRAVLESVAAESVGKE